MLSGIQMRAILIALFAFYVAPVIPLVILTSIPNFFGFDPTKGHSLIQTPFVLALAWAYAFAPVGAAYFAAKLARQQPLLHGLLVGIAGALLVTLWLQGAMAFKIPLAMLVVSCGLFGGWLWRYRNAKPDSL